MISNRSSGLVISNSRGRGSMSREFLNATRVFRSESVLGDVPSLKAH
jgi:hypothetical protein